MKVEDRLHQPSWSRHSRLPPKVSLELRVPPRVLTMAPQPLCTIFAQLSRLFLDQFSMPATDCSEHACAFVYDYILYYLYVLLSRSLAPRTPRCLCPSKVH